jgi:hypothetical protein
LIYKTKLILCRMESLKTLSKSLNILSLDRTADDIDP